MRCRRAMVLSVKFFGMSNTSLAVNQGDGCTRLTEPHHRVRLIMVISPDRRHRGHGSGRRPPRSRGSSFSHSQSVWVSTRRAGHGQREPLVCCYRGTDVGRSLSMTHKEMRCPASLLSRIALHVLAYDLRRLADIGDGGAIGTPISVRSALTGTLRAQGSLSTAVAPDRHLYARRNRMQ